MQTATLVKPVRKVAILCHQGAATGFHGYPCSSWVTRTVCDRANFVYGCRHIRFTLLEIEYQKEENDLIEKGDQK